MTDCEGERLSAKVAVIIPAYNRASFIRETIDSVLNQTYENIALFVVDDGSTDNTLKLLQEYGSQIVVLQHPGGTNKGQSAAINLGIRESESEYIAILDSDDLFDHKKIQKQVEFLEKHPDIGLVYSNGAAIDESGKYLYTMFDKGHKEYNNPEMVLLDCYFNVPSNSLVRRTAFEQAGEFDETLRSAQDHDMAIRLSEVTSLAYLDEVLWYYRRHPDTQSGQHADRRWQLGFYILDKAVKRYPYSSKIKRKRRAVLHFRLGQCSLENKRMIKALFHFLAAGILDPLRSFYVLIGKEQATGNH